eukprot:TRINITY_DN6811_c0_g2_i1.p1 TRINITY_DN6811_c0_g2~~TRINITY_DN6811_c0_g2_i1.p1  ORF type:complete len:423 (+),score=113.18 TRINITY_DN6811_c0_g2_i1:171-1439(+)
MHRMKKVPANCKVAFFHPDLGIGGAERLVVDAAVALQERGCHVTVYTSHHEPDRCFKETADGTLDVRVYGDWMPRHLFDRFYALFAYLRMIYLALVVMLTNQYDVVVCDQVSACIPIIKLLSRSKVLFYCHFPDMLLTQRQSALKALYRAPLDWLEETTTGMADTVMVNSRFTAGIFRKTFTRLRHIQPAVLYPSLQFAAFDKDVSMKDADRLVGTSGRYVFLSINRYERKKNLMLALQAFRQLQEALAKGNQTELWQQCHLVMAGGYDPRLPENVDYFAELEAYASKHLPDKVSFLRSFSDDDKLVLLRRCCALVYTPENEHFGICPVEAMYMGRPVIAVNSGGPMESVAAEPFVHTSKMPARTGYLCHSEPDDIARAMEHLITHDGLAAEMGSNGTQRVITRFSFNAFAQQLWDAIAQLQ